MSTDTTPPLAFHFVIPFWFGQDNFNGVCCIMCISPVLLHLKVIFLTLYLLPLLK